MKPEILCLAAVPCAIAALAAHGFLDATTRGWPALAAVAVVLLGITTGNSRKAVRIPARNRK